MAIKLVVKIGRSSIPKNQQKIQIPVEVRVFDGRTPKAGESLVFKEGMTNLKAFLTDPSGTARYVFEFDASRAKEIVEIGAQLINEPVEKFFMVTLPDIVQATKTDPHNLSLFSYTDEKTGQACIDCQVNDEHGNGLSKRKVRFFIQDPDCLFPPVPTNPTNTLPPSHNLPYHEVETDDEGGVIFLFPRKLKKGEVIDLYGKLSGVPETCSIQVSRAAAKRVKKSKADKFFSKPFIRWAGLSTNNKRARFFWIMAVASWIYCIKIGFGSFGADGEHWQKYVWLSSFFFTWVACPVYTVAAMREELKAIWIDSAKKLRNKHKGTANDPFFERLLEMAGEVSSARNHAKPDLTAVSGGAVAVPSNKKASIGVSIGQMFASDMAAEFAFDFISKAFTKIVRG